MVRYHNINGVKVQFTAEEETARDLEEQAWADGAFDRAISELRTRRNYLLAQKTKRNWLFPQKNKNKFQKNPKKAKIHVEVEQWFPYTIKKQKFIRNIDIYSYSLDSNS